MENIYSRHPLSYETLLGMFTDGALREKYGASYIKQWLQNQARADRPQVDDSERGRLSWELFLRTPELVFPYESWASLTESTDLSDISHRATTLPHPFMEAWDLSKVSIIQGHRDLYVWLIEQKTLSHLSSKTCAVTPVNPGRPHVVAITDLFLGAWRYAELGSDVWDGARQMLTTHAHHVMTHHVNESAEKFKKMVAVSLDGRPIEADIVAVHVPSKNDKERGFVHLLSGSVFAHEKIVRTSSVSQNLDGGVIPCQAADSDGALNIPAITEGIIGSDSAFGHIVATPALTNLSNEQQRVTLKDSSGAEIRVLIVSPHECPFGLDLSDTDSPRHQRISY